MKTSKRGGGGHFRSKRFRCGFFGNFEGKTKNFFFWDEKFVAKKRNIVFRPEGGGSEAVWKFSENSSKMVHRNVPKSEYIFVFKAFTI